MTLVSKTGDDLDIDMCAHQDTGRPEIATSPKQANGAG